MSRPYVPHSRGPAGTVCLWASARPGLLLGLLAVGQAALAASVAADGGQPLLTILIAVHAFDNAVVALGAAVLCRRVLPLAGLGQLRYFLHACGTALGVHYCVRLACRLGVGWAAGRWTQLHAGAASSGLLVTYCLREVVAALFGCVGVDPTAEHPPLGSCLARESLLVAGRKDFVAADLGDTVVYKPKNPRCGLELGTQFSLLALIAAGVSLLSNPPAAEGADAASLPLLLGVAGAVVCNHMHRIVRRCCLRSPAALRRIRLLCDGLASACWLLGCAQAERGCSRLAVGGGGKTAARSFGDLYTASDPHAVLGKEPDGAKADDVELWTLVELVEHGLGGGVPAGAAADGGLCGGPMVMGGVEGSGGVLVGATLCVPAVLLPLLFAAVRCDAFSGGLVGGPAASQPVLSRGWCTSTGPSGWPRGMVVGGFQLLFVGGTQSALWLYTLHPAVGAALPLPPALLEAAVAATLLLHCAAVCSDPDPVAWKTPSSADKDLDPVERLLAEDQRRRARAQGLEPPTNFSGGAGVCGECGLERGGELRGYHCGWCGRCVALRDHHCEWIGVCVGRNNTATFISLLSVMVLCVAGGCLDLVAGLWQLHAAGELSWASWSVGLALLGSGGGVACYVGWLLFYMLGLWATGSTWNEEHRRRKQHAEASPGTPFPDSACRRFVRCVRQPSRSVRPLPRAGCFLAQNLWRRFAQAAELASMLGHCMDTERRGRRL